MRDEGRVMSGGGRVMRDKRRLFAHRGAPGSASVSLVSGRTRQRSAGASSLTVGQRRNTATPDATAHRLALLALAAAIGGASGAAAATIIARAGAQEPPAPRQGAEEQPERRGSRTVRHNIVQTRAGPMVIPITPEQWRATLEERDERFGDHGLR